MNENVEVVDRNLLLAFARDEKGQAATEYILVIALIVIPIAVVFNKLQSPLKSLLDRLAKGFRGPGV